MRTVDAGLFELLFEELVEEVARSAQPLVVTKDGRPVAELRPLARGRRAGGRADEGGHGSHGIRFPTGGRSNGGA